MANKATQDQKLQLETISQIDTMVTVLGDYPESTLAASVDVNPFGFLIDICKSLGIYDELINFIVQFIKYELPIVELAVKGLLLAKLKNSVSCSIDPFIPDYMRKKNNSTADNGLVFAINELDYNSMLDIDPMKNGSEYTYLGIPREYAVDLRVIQQYDSKNIYQGTSKEFETYAEAKSWITDKSKKYLDESKYKIEKNIWEKRYFKEEIEGRRGKSRTVIEEIDVTDDGPAIDNIGDEVLSLKKIKYYSDISIQEIFPKNTLGSCLYDIKEDSELQKEEEGRKSKKKGTKLVFNTFVKAKRAYRRAKRRAKKDFAQELKEGAVIVGGVNSYVYMDANELARAKDFNAFLWYVIHMANFNDPIKIKLTSGNVEISEVYNVKYVTNKKYGPLGIMKFTQSSADDMTASNMLGNTFVLNDGNDSSLIDICVRSEIGKNDAGKEIKTYTVVPATSDNISLNWYGDRKKYFDFLKYYSNPHKEPPRSYENEIGICNIEFNELFENTPNFVRNQIRFTILPKPLVYIPTLQIVGDVGIKTPWNVKRILFNSKGEFDKHGKYSVYTTLNNEQKPDLQTNKGSDKGDYPYYYTLANKSHEGVGIEMYIPKDWSKGVKFSNNSETPPVCSLYECYPGLTVYEFNYDYIMSQRLFEPKVIVGQLIENILNCPLHFDYSLERKKTLDTERFVEVIKNIITADTYVSSDCYDSFSNEKYDAMSQQTEEKKAQGFHFGGDNRVASVNVQEIQDILNEYDDPDISQEGQSDVLNRAFNQVNANITDATSGKQKWDFKFNFILQLIYNLIFIIINSLLTPKFLMIIKVNKELMGKQQWSKDILKDLMNILIDTIKDLIKQLKDILLNELLNFVLDFLKPKFEELAALIMKEYYEYYKVQIEAMIKACRFGKRKKLDTKLDFVDYADIDPIEGEELDKEC